MTPRYSARIYRACGLYGWTIVDASGAFVATGPMEFFRSQAIAACEQAISVLLGQASLLPELAPARPLVEQGRLF